MGNTLGLRVQDQDLQRQSSRQLASLLGTAEPPEALRQRLNERETAYRAWARQTQIELDERELWTRWLLPDYPAEHIAPLAEQLMHLWRKQLGRHVLRPEASQAVRELSRRGYRLGVISNTISPHDAPDMLADYGLGDYFSTVILSCVFGRRKPDPAIFLAATHEAQVSPACSAYVGDKFDYDIVGARRAGFGLAIQIQSPASAQAKCEADEPPDAIVENLMQVVDRVTRSRSFSNDTWRGRGHASQHSGYFS
jgi:HAD superfamily hydrolase (TIGR01549 family)